jgi:hypothetical protein
MSQQSIDLVILFADITGSTTMYEKHGNEKAKQMVTDCLAVLVSKTEDEGGQLIATIGDEVMVRFDSADQAYQAAIAMQEAHSIGPVSIRIGFNYGPIIQEGTKYFGDAINVAARMAARATAGEIMTTGETVRQLSHQFQPMTRHVDTTTVKGKREEIEIFEVLWQLDDDKDETILGMVSNPSAAQSDSSLELKYEDQVLSITQSGQKLTIGRYAKNDIVVDADESFASRNHANIEFTRGKFLLTDQSANGTYIAMPDDQMTLLKRESAELIGSGKIGLGKSPKDEGGAVIFYRRMN